MYRSPACAPYRALRLVVGALSLLLACQPAAAPAKPAPAPASATAAATPAAPSAEPPKPADGAAPAAQSATSAEWERTVAAAKGEGRVAVAGPPFPGLTSGLTRGFEQAYGISVDYVGAAAVAQLAPRIEQESAAGRPSLDIVISGGSTVATLVPKGLLEPIKHKLLPAVTDPTRWRDGQITWVDKDGDKMLRAAEWQWPALFVNPRLIEPSSIRTWDDLLKPEYKGKITAFDPLVGIGSGVSSYLFYVKGEEYVVRLFRDQDVNVVRDNQQIASQVARGTYPIGLGLTQAAVEPLRKEGLPIEAVFPAEEPINVTSGFGIIQMVKNPPHPNAAIVFLNWFLTKEGQEVYERGTLEPSRRVDIMVPETPEYVKMRPDPRPRIDNGTTEWWVEIAPTINRRLEEVLKR